MLTHRCVSGRWVRVAAVLLSLLWLTQTATASGWWVVDGGPGRSAVPLRASAVRSVGDFLAADGVLRVPEAYQGSLDLAGWQGWIDEAGSLRFAREGVGGATRLQAPNSFSPLGSGWVGTSGTVTALAVLGGDIYLSGGFVVAGGAMVNYVARYNPLTNTFSPLGGGTVGTEATVRAMTTLGGKLYLGGIFIHAGGVTVNYIARYDPVTDTFSPLGTQTVGTDGEVVALTTLDGYVYLGGAFTHADGKTVNNIAYYSPIANTFYPLGSGPLGQGTVGTSGVVGALTTLGADLYLGGYFATAGQATVNNVARYSPTTNSFTPLGSDTVGTNYVVQALTALDGDLYLGGGFTQAGGITVNYVARYDPDTHAFSPLGQAAVGTDYAVNVLAALDGDLYIGGAFTQAGGVTVNYVTRYNPVTNEFKPLGRETVGTDWDVRALLAVGHELLLGGAFYHAGGVTVNYIARYTPIEWPLGFSSLGIDAVGTSGTVAALASLGDDLYVGGHFATAGGVIVNNIARYHLATNTFSPLGSGTVGVDGMVRSLTVLGGDLYLGGQFNTADGVMLNRVARYSPATNMFSPLGSGTVGVDGETYALTTLGGDVYLGGNFIAASGVTVNRVARYNPSANTFSPLGSGTVGTNYTVYTLGILDGDVYLGGLFTTAGSVTVNHIARYNPASQTFTPLGPTGNVGTDNAVAALTAMDSVLYVGGGFTTAGGVTVNRVARYSPVTNMFSPLGSGAVGTTATVSSLLPLNGVLYLGGGFAQAGGITVNYVARYDPTTNTFSPLGRGTVGTNWDVWALATLGPDLYLGGNFDKAGGLTVNFVARYIMRPPLHSAAWRAGTWYLRNSLSAGPAEVVFSYGLPTDKPLMCDWDGNGSKTVGVFRDGAWYLRNSNDSGDSDIAISYGVVGDTPVCGDWDGDGVETVGVVRVQGGQVAWYLRNSNTNGALDVAFLYGGPGDRPAVGDWDGNGTDTPGILRNGVWFLRNSNTSGPQDLFFSYGLASDTPIVGDWDADGTDTVGVVRGNTWYLRNANSTGYADSAFPYGAAGDTMLVWR